LKWIELSVVADGELIDPLVQIFDRYSKNGVVLENVKENSGHLNNATKVRTYLNTETNYEIIFNQIDIGVRLLSHVGVVSRLSKRVVDEKEWHESWKKHFSILEIGKTLAIVPSWLNSKEVDRKVIIELDPGMAFGTGHHPTTRMCLEMLEILVKPEDAILDLGCGSGILSIASAKMGSEKVIGIDNDETAVKVAMENIEINGISKSVLILTGSIPNKDMSKYSNDIIVANISNKIILDLSIEITEHLKPGGHLIVSGFLDINESEIINKFKELNLSVLSRLSTADWVALSLRN
jgi:ribosomal protein L11 methyltransferase